jgi:hypothetical protein
MKSIILFIALSVSSPFAQADQVIQTGIPGGSAMDLLNQKMPVPGPSKNPKSPLFVGVTCVQNGRELKAGDPDYESCLSNRGDFNGTGSKAGIGAKTTFGK